MNTLRLHIRNYRKGDFPAVEKLWLLTDMGGRERGDDEDAIEATLDKGGKLLILEIKETGEIVGTSWLTNDGRRIYLHHFAITPSLQGLGFSKLLLKESVLFAKEKDLKIKLEVRERKKKVVILYKKEGFRYLGDYDIYIIREWENNKEQK